MSIPGYIDRQAGRDRLKQQLLARLGPNYVPPEGWDAFLLSDDPVRDVKCQMCGRMVFEIRPFGPNHESICEECAAKDMATTTMRYLEINPNA